MGLTRNFILMQFFLLIIGCSESSGSKSEPGPVIKAIIECENTNEIQFKWDWCNQNLETGDISNICYGTVVYQDMIFSSIKLEKGSLSKQCLFAGGSWEDINLDGCHRGIRREYSPIYGELVKIQIDECYDSSQEVISVKGQLDTQQPFNASKP